MTLSLFQGFGVELEYMIVDAGTLNVRPIADAVLAAANGGEITSDVDRGPVSWSNELVAHVLEVKSNGPAPSLEGLVDPFAATVQDINGILAPQGARLLPTAAHPWMNPLKETKLWPHDYSVVYEAYNRIFDCRGHGWSNLQSVHLNLPFANDEEFGRLHAAIRLVLPILPALAASSPIIELRRTGWLDTRLEYYRTNSQKVRSLTGDVIPEPVFTREDYDREIFQRIYQDIAPHDPDGVLRDEFLNSRGAIARFGRGAIEIRVLDIQECPLADLALLHGIVGLLRALAEENLASREAQRAWAVEPLKAIFLKCVKEGERTPIDNQEYLRLFGYTQERATAGQLWKHIGRRLGLFEGRLGETFRTLVDAGTLASRIMKSMGTKHPSKEAVSATYRQLAEALATNRPFLPA